MTMFNAAAFAGIPEVAALAGAIAEQYQTNANTAAIAKEGKGTLTDHARNLAIETFKHGLTDAQAYAAVTAALGGLLNDEGATVIPKGSIKAMATAGKGWNAMLHAGTAEGSVESALETVGKATMKDAQDYVASDETKELAAARKRLTEILDAKLPRKGENKAKAADVTAVCDFLARSWAQVADEADNADEARTGTEG